MAAVKSVRGALVRQTAGQIRELASFSTSMLNLSWPCPPAETAALRDHTNGTALLLHTTALANPSLLCPSCSMAWHAHRSVLMMRPSPTPPLYGSCTKLMGWCLSAFSSTDAHSSALSPKVCGLGW